VTRPQRRLAPIAAAGGVLGLRKALEPGTRMRLGGLVEEGSESLLAKHDENDMPRGDGKGVRQ
jgi:cytochrome c-type biogenesis protein CcmE